MTSALKNETQDNTVETLANIVSKETGIQLNDKHHPMVLNRITKRMKELNLNEPKEYLNYFLKNEATEKEHLVSLLTTHHTFFFREFSQFEYLGDVALANICKAVRARGENKVKVWSAACSQGQEVYSLAMYLDYHLKTIDPGMGYEILGSDVDKKSVLMGQNGVYPKKELNAVSLTYLGNHWAKGTGDISDFVRAKQSLRDRTKFETLNLQETHKFPNQKFDIIFCRNVFIYFNRQQMKDITNAFIQKLHNEGLLFVGISESLYGLEVPVHPAGPSIYSKTPLKPVTDKSAPAKTTSFSSGTTTAPTPLPPEATTAAAPAQILKVLCVDDSPIIHTLMKKLFVKENGFEIVGHAMNGLEAKKKLAECKPDVVTLDIHMPEQDGISYLKENYNPSHPPVIMVTSVNREDSELATEALKYGASDFVEKPTLANLSAVGDEIRTKLRMAFKAKQNDPNKEQPKNLSFDQEFAKKVTVTNSTETRRIFIFNSNQPHKMKQYLSMEEKTNTAPFIAVVDLPRLELKKYAENLFKETKLNFTIPDMGKITQPAPAQKYLLSSVDDLFILKALTKDKVRSYLIAGVPTSALANHLCDVKAEKKDIQFIIDELTQSKLTPPVKALAQDSLPVTSFAYVSNLYFSKSKK